jgi:Family of unknown function (DUF6221)
MYGEYGHVEMSKDEYFDLVTASFPTTIETPDPRLWAECEAKRQIVEDLEEYAADYRAAPSDFAAGRRHAALLAATRVAAVYAGHPDYLPEWRP